MSRKNDQNQAAAAVKQKLTPEEKVRLEQNQKMEQQMAAEAAAQAAPLTPAEQQELALRAELEGRGYTRADFESARGRRNYLVEAGAGAGKTHIMIQRIVNQLVSGYREPEDIVAITFTRKSTLEMQQRLDRELKERLKALTARTEPLDQAQQALEKRLRDLLRKISMMQVSTIHSFCQTMLEAMPFSSKLGLDMQVIENEEPLAAAFLKRKRREDVTLFDVPRQMGVWSDSLDQLFLRCLNNNEAALCYTPVDSGEVRQWTAEVRDAVPNLQRALHQLSPLPLEVREGLRTLAEMEPSQFVKDHDACRKLIWLSMSSEAHCPLERLDKDDCKNKEMQADFLQNAGKPVNDIWLGKWGAILRTSARYMNHSYIMEDMDHLLREYRAEKEARHIATYNDLLLRTRDMLRDDPAARAYFHSRYQVIYVDEMQDTDPVQTEMLFYLTTGEADFDAANWKNCKPVPGSLFLVGDPKQAIYRFRGADISVYNDLLELFPSREQGVSGANEKVTLRFNFRSSTNICALATEVFQPEAGVQVQEPHKFVGGKYHAEYVAMNARSGDCPRARTMYYKPASNSSAAQDVKRVSAFIYKMIQDERYVGIHRPDPQDPTRGKHAHKAQPEDFLILTQEKKEAIAYAQELRSYGIPAEVSGEKSLGEVAPVARTVLHLEYLLHVRDDHKLLLVLRECYGLTNEQLRLFLQRTGQSSLTGAVKEEKLEKLQRALHKEQQPDSDLLAVCAAMEELVQLRKLAATLPAMAVIETLLEGGCGVWRGLEQESLQQRRWIWAEVQQYLNMVRSGPQRGFRALAAYAIECAQKKLEMELGLTPDSKAVRIMNLHKAKGLEAEVVILAYGDRTVYPPNRHVKRSGSQAWEYRCLFAGYAKSPILVACHQDWAAQAAEEQAYLEAEHARLLYVAATRAKTMLLVCLEPSKFSQSYWKALGSGLAGVDTEVRTTQEKKKSDPAYKEPYYYEEAFKLLERANNQLKPASAAADKDAKAVNPVEMEQKLETIGGQLARKNSFAITPSKLEKNHRGVVVRRDRDGEDAAETQADPQGNPVPEDIDGEDPPQSAPAVQAETAEAFTGPYGPEWGTMVHRVMELTVKENTYTADVLQSAGRQAIHELLVEGALKAKQRRLLGLTDEDTAEKIVNKLLPDITQAAAFLLDGQSPLRALLARGRAYPELPFILRARPDDEQMTELYQHLQAHISSASAKERALAVEGIIDLAIQAEDGWYIVDYKTDRRDPGESDEALAERLREEYTPQITAYARVLEKMGGAHARPVKGAWLCSVPLGGRLIALNVNGPEAT